MPPGAGGSGIERARGVRRDCLDGLAFGVAGGAAVFDRAGLEPVTPQRRWRALGVEAATVTGSAWDCAVHAGTAAELER